MKIVLAQIRVIAMRPDLNFKSIEKSIAVAKAEGAELVVFPEMCVSGYFLGDHRERQEFLNECESFGRKICELSHGIYVLFGNVAIEHNQKGEDGRVRKFNAAFLAHEGKFVKNKALGASYWPKTLMPNYREFDDSRHFFDLRKLALELSTTPQNLITPVAVNTSKGEINLGITICEDAWSDDYFFSPAKELCQKGAHVLLNLSCSPFTLGKTEKRERVFSKIATENKVPLFSVNAVGTQNVGKTVYGFDGASIIFNSEGKLLAKGSFFSESILSETSGVSKLHNRMSQLQVALESIIRFTCEEWKISKVVVGVSGGIDSALSATIFCRVLGKENVLLVNMPSKFNSELTKTAAKKLADNLGCSYIVAPIQNSVNQTLVELSALKFEGWELKLQKNSTIEENIQARDRGGRILASIAAMVGGVFTCNANKSEATPGFATLYGDLAGFLAPLADLWKHDVYALSRFYNESVFQKEIIPSEPLEVVPSPELSNEHDVTQGKGDPIIYPYHDYLFKSWVESWERKTPYDTLLAYSEGRLEESIGCEKGLIKKLFPNAKTFIADLEKWWSLYCGLGAVKRMQAPPVVGITQRSFGFDHREHLGHVYFGENYLKLKDKLLS